MRLLNELNIPHPNIIKFNIHRQWISHNLSYNFLNFQISGVINIIFIQLSLSLYKFWFSDWLICTMWYWVVTKTTSMTSLSWCNSCGVNSTHHCHHTTASTDSKFVNLSDADIDSLIDDAIPINTKKATAWGISVLKS